ENPGQTPGVANLRNCFDTNATDQTFATAGGNVDLSTGTITACTADGQPGDGYAVRATLANVNDYRARCLISAASVRCTVEAQ
ncbi:MAG: prepilin-type cleavage/methylation domain-containing protein, partial [Aquificaceae bacterium]|nr:prepilin-type cleavage/methylation domain-containing protein [Aquificaceae bacterium]